MFAKLINIINRINNRFTYRQRFVFFSFVFILTTPFPGYWLLQVENFFINRLQWQLVGNRYQELVGDLMYDVLEHRIANTPKQIEEDWSGTANIKKLHASIEQQFNKLERLNVETEFVVRPKLGEGFSETVTEAIDLQRAHDFWLELEQTALNGERDQLDTAHVHLISMLQEILSNLDNTFQLIVAPTEVQQFLIDSSSALLPEAQELITSVFFLHQRQIENPSRELELEKLILMERLQNNKKKTHLLLTNAYRNYSNELSTKEATLISAKQAYADYYASVNNFLQKLMTNNTIPVMIVNKALEANKATRDSNMALTNALISNQLSWFRIAKNFSVFVYMWVALTLTFYIIFRVLTRHLMEICYHLRDMTKGHFKECFCSHFDDEFGLIGRTFDKMGQSIQDVLGELKNVGSQLSGSIEQITSTAKTQEESASEQEKQVREIEDTAKLIATESRNLADTMNSLSKSSVEVTVADTAKEGLDRMQEKMGQLATVSTEIITSLTNLQNKVIGSNTLIAFMGKVSDQASLLSLNSAIETANIKKHKTSFMKITQEIQRFAEKTSESTGEIGEIINDITISVSDVIRDANGCLKEISEGAHRLINVSTQLSNITKQGKEQIKKFETVNDVMQMQAIAAENIIHSISNLGETAEENTRSIHLLHQNIEELGKTAAELQKTIGLFVS